MSGCKATFAPGGEEAVVEEGTDLLTAAIVAGVPLRSDCGGEGVCGRCKVIVRDGQVSSDLGERLTVEERQAGYVLACRATIQGDVKVEVPPESRLSGAHVLTEGSQVEPRLFTRIATVEKGVELAERVLYTSAPLATKLYLQLPQPTVSDNISDVDRLYREIRQVSGVQSLQMGLANLRHLPRLLRESHWKVTVTLGQRDGTTELVLIEPGDTSASNYAVVMDIGTTTVAVSLVDLCSHQVLGTRGTHNPQSRYGEDVITRIIYAQKEEGLQRLHGAVVDPINEMISELTVEHGISLNDITAAVCAGNTTMTHLLLRIDPSYIRRGPYVPAARAAPVIRAREAGLQINPRGLMACLPGVSSYVGADITAGVVASGIDEAEQPCMLIDLGTNGEIVLGNSEWLVCCSASAGPAFEGSGVQCGVLAMEGAVQRVKIRPDTCDVCCTTIGDARAVGICGSGYLDLLAELFRRKVIDRQGVFAADLATARVRDGSDSREYVVVWAAESATGRDIVITQTDIQHLVRSKGAVFSAARSLVAKMGLTFDGVEKIYIAGGLGSYLDIAKAISIGLLPDLPIDRFEYIGNSSLTGARMALLSLEAADKARQIAERMTNIELCHEPAYMGEYVSALFLPHTEIELFPTVQRELEEAEKCPGR
jgi:uncharacterized 2Fe-2S/4Fe-4S cluster protein (DUF4445 family)